MGIEYELKFKADPQVLQTLEEKIAGPAQHFDMHTTYYDTPSQSLSARWYTLRRRMENHVSVCTLKTPADGYGRKEFEVNCQKIEDAIPLLCKLGCPPELPQLVQEGLLEVCGAKFHRIARTLTLEACTVELALDQGFLTGGGKQIPLCEVEVELKSGNPEAAKQFALQLAALYALAPEPRSKFRRALALYKGE